jgi:hypothetical protein
LCQDDMLSLSLYINFKKQINSHFTKSILEGVCVCLET